MDNTTIAIIQGLITILSTGGVALVLRAQIQAQKEQIIAMQGNISSMKSFMDIFNIDELHKYVDTMKRTFEAERKEIQIATAKQVVDDTVKEMEDKVLEPVMQTLKKGTETMKFLGEDNLKLTKEKGDLNLENTKLKYAVDVFIKSQNLNKEKVYAKIYSQTGMTSIQEIEDE